MDFVLGTLDMQNIAAFVRVLSSGKSFNKVGNALVLNLLAPEKATEDAYYMQDVLCESFSMAKVKLEPQSETPMFIT